MEEIPKAFHQDAKIKKSKTTIIGSILLTISALLPCLDVFLKWFFPSIIEMKDSTGVLITTNIWLATLYISPSIIILATQFKPNPRLYFFPLAIFFYTGLIYFAPTFGFKIDFLLFNSITTAIISILAGLAQVFLLKYVRRITLEESIHTDFISDVKLEFEKLKQENTFLKEKILTQNGKYER